MNDIVQLLKKTGPGLTSELIERLRKKGVSPVTARKRIQRAQHSYKRLAGLRFEKNARFVYLEEQFGKPIYWEKLEEAFKTTGKSYWSAIAMLKARGNLVLKDHFARIAGAPEFRRGQLSPERILERLKSINVLEEVEDSGRVYIRFKPCHYGKLNLGSSDFTEFLANEVAENVLLEGVRQWGRSLGFGSHGKFALRSSTSSNLPKVSGIVWDLTAPSYIRPLVSVTHKLAKPGFLVCDVNLYGSVELSEAEAFVRKCDMAAAPQKVSPIMPMLVGHSFSAEAFSYLKSRGILALTVENLFGEALAEALKELVQMLTDLGAKISVDPDALLKVMQTLTKITGTSDNLRGSLFELVVGGVVKEVEGGFLKVGERKTHLKSGQPTEIDVQLDRGPEKGVLVIECKAKLPTARVSEQDIKKWYEDRVPLRHSILANDGNYTEKPFRYELWTNGVFAKSGLEWLSQQRTESKHYTIGWKDGEALKKYASRAKSPALRNILNNFYFKSPVPQLSNRATCK